MLAGALLRVKADHGDHSGDDGEQRQRRDTGDHLTRAALGTLGAIVAKRDPDARVWTLDWRPERLSASFHGRDLFMPAAALLATGQHVARTPIDPARMVGADAPPDLAEVVYIDSYGNAMTGLRANTLPVDGELLAGDRQIPRARTFADVAPGQALWYANSSGLAEIAVNQGRADRDLGLKVGAPVTLHGAPAGDA